MTYHIILKFEIVEGNYTESKIGYVNSHEDCETVNSTHNYDSMQSWINANENDLANGVKTINEFFVSTPTVYGCSLISNDTYGLSLITDLNNPE